jgi:methionyl-tRNA synthetase
MSAFYITTAIEYANGEPHLGHAFEKIGADAIARFHRLRGDDVRLLVGTDEHGLKVARAAAAAGIAPAEQAERSTARFRATWDTLGIAYDVFARTTDPHHASAVQTLIHRIRERHPDAFYERAYEGRYCVGCEAFKTPYDLAGGRCPVHPTLDVEVVSETNWFFRLSAFAPFLETHLREHPDFVQPASRRNEILALLARGLEDVSITRANLDWGTRFPVASSSGVHQAIYVWFDALPNYLTFGGWPETLAGWPAQVHVVGKDITRFHGLLWPAILHAAGLPLPEQIWAHGFVTVGGERLSKSDGVTVDLPEAIARHGVDALRHHLLREVPFDGDGDFSWERFDARYAADLANTLGNLASRVTALVARSCAGGVVPSIDRACIGERERALDDIASRSLERYVAAFEGRRPHRALDAVFETLAAGNEYVTRTAPWTLAKAPARARELHPILGTLVRLLARQAVLLGPAIPGKADALWRALGGPGSVHAQRLAGLAGLDPAGWRVSAGEPLFPRAAAAR